MGNLLSKGKRVSLNKSLLKVSVREESKLFECFYEWLTDHMPTTFFEEFTNSQVMTIARSLMGFSQQGQFVQIHFRHCSIVLCSDGPDADLTILKNYGSFGINNYQTFISDQPPPLSEVTKKLRIAILHFTKVEEPDRDDDYDLLHDSFEIGKSLQDEIFQKLTQRSPTITKDEFDILLNSTNPQFFQGITKERLILAFEVLHRAMSRDTLQYEVKYNKEWKETSKDVPSIQIVFAWKNTQKHNFLYKLAKLIFRHKLVMKRVNASYVNKDTSQKVLLMSLGLHGMGNKAAWEQTDIEDFFREMSSLKHFPQEDLIERAFTNSDILSGNMSNLIRSMISFAHQLLLHVDSNLYTLRKIEESICAHRDLISTLAKAFEEKFHYKNSNLKNFEKIKKSYISAVNKIDTGNFHIDIVRKKILLTMMEIIVHTYKTNFYEIEKSTISFRTSPEILSEYEQFTELPYGIFFIQGQSFIGFHIRFKDLSRGGLRTIFPKSSQQGIWERDNILTECYNLANTQQKKNKDIPEGGSKGIIFLESIEEMELESSIYQRELKSAKLEGPVIEQLLKQYRKDQYTNYLYHAQRSYICALLTLIDCDEKNTLKAKKILDYYKRPEYIYLGPDENMHNSMIEWISQYSKKRGYKLGSAFISSKPKYGINHKEYGVTSLGVHVYIEEVLKYLGIDPKRNIFTVKMSGGPDGDVAGNQIYNFYKFYRKNTKILAITDGSGTIYDPKGLDIHALKNLFKKGQTINFYPPKLLSSGSFLLDLQSKKEVNTYAYQTLLIEKVGKKIERSWLSGNETHHMYTKHLHQVKTDIFIPAGGRPQTISEGNWRDFLDSTNRPTSKAIVEAANLYLTKEARQHLEELGVIIIKDSSANKCGVICSSLEVLTSLLLNEEEFLKIKTSLMKEVLKMIANKALKEAVALISEHNTTKQRFTILSDEISRKINRYTYEILDYLETINLKDHPLLSKCLIKYCPKTLVKKYKGEAL